MQESETRFDNMPMPAFKIPIMFKSVRRYSEMGYTMGLRERTEGLNIRPHYLCTSVLMVMLK